MSTVAEMRFPFQDRNIEFLEVPLKFENCVTTDLFARKNNKTVGETVGHKRYRHLVDVLAQYPTCSGRRLGDFLFELKTAGNPSYKRFLNAHGDLSYCRFSIEDVAVCGKTGIYCFVLSNCIKYVGKSTDSFGKRINQGYGQIHPKNCYRDGQSTNCHLNALIADCTERIKFFVYSTNDHTEIESLERTMICSLRPEWNVHLKLGTPEV